MSGARVALFEGEWWASTTYLAEFVERLKDEIPAGYRRWDKAHKMWRVDPAYRRELEALLAYYYGGYEAVSPAELGLEPERQRPGPKPASQPADHFSVLHLLPTAPPELVRAAYKTLALLNHPDRGGDTQAMQAINAAYERLK